jgi:septum formation protein
MEAIRPVRMVLASSSPRRRQLLAQAGYVFEISSPGFDESAFRCSARSPRKQAEALALAKAQSVAPKYPDSLVIGADTLVDSDGEIIGKPVDVRDAESITRKLFSAPHKVITGLALIRLSDNTKRIRSDVTVVYPRSLTERQIARHIAGGSWEGKAGAYAIQETGDAFIERIEGSLTNVMGLPLELLQQLLKGLIGRQPRSSQT